MVDEYWVHSRGGKRFTTGPTPPELFFCLGTQDRGESEYLFLMWYRHGRRFWFYDQFVVFVCESDASVEGTRDRLEAALQRWERSAGDVIYSGCWGGLDAGAGRFDRDPFDHSRREDWKNLEDAGLRIERLVPCPEPEAEQGAFPRPGAGGGPSQRRWWQFWK
jgi:hypothetical protein